jgi:hypothetical protein
MLRIAGWTLFLAGVALYAFGEEHLGLGRAAGPVGIAVMVAGAVVTCAANLAEWVAGFRARRKRILELEEERRRPPSAPPS